MPYRDVLAIRPFRDLWLGQAISQLGDAFYFLIFLFMVDRLSGDPRIVGYTGALETLPFLLFSLHAGVVADRKDRRSILLFADVSSAALLGLFAVLVACDPTPPISAILVMGFLLGLVNVFFLPAKNATIPAIVPADLLMKANSLSAATQNMMPLIGLGLSGGVLGALYAVYPNYFFLSAVILNALSFLGSAFFVRRLPPVLPDKAAGARQDPWHDLRDGLRYVRRTHVLAVLLVLGVLFQLMVSPFMVVYVTVNREWFGGGFGTLALMEWSFVVALVLSSVVVGRMELRHPGRAYIAGLAVVGLTVAAMSVSRSVALFAFWNFVAGLAVPFAEIPMNAYIQTIVPDAYQGRVNSVIAMTSIGVQPLGVVAAGVLLEAIGPAAMFLVMGIGMGLAALAGLLDRPFRTAALPVSDPLRSAA